MGRLPLPRRPERRRGHPDVVESGKPLGRYFPKSSTSSRTQKARGFVDGELILPSTMSFDALHAPPPGRAASASWRRKRRPAHALRLPRARRANFAAKPLVDRREYRRSAPSGKCRDGLLLSPANTDRDVALQWLNRSGGALDGVIAKRLDLYRFGERAGDGQGQAAAHRRLRGRRLPLRRKEARSARCCSASTTMTACSIMSASPRRLPARTARR